MSLSSPAELGEHCSVAPLLRDLPMRTRLAVAGARFGAAVSRLFAAGGGGVIGGRIALKLDPKRRNGSAGTAPWYW
ncbi:hypothetical protein GCM10017788_59100 [Amycolatopsis acidiphila]|nr:hypothetical protein GCM10017788_59100 [Amycolatopsis acidiphila]